MFIPRSKLWSVSAAGLFAFALATASGCGSEDPETATVELGGADVASDTTVVDGHAPEAMTLSCTLPDDPEALPLAPELEGGLGWINTDRPLRFDGDLAGKVVLLDFWTYGCINCIHMMPRLRQLEEHFEGLPFVVIGVHSAKFHNEGQILTITAAMEHNELYHPAVVDTEKAIWKSYGVSAWPTLVLVGADGRIRWTKRGESSFETMRSEVAGELCRDEARGILDDGPLILPTIERPGATLPLFYPSKIEAGPDGLIAVADSAHHRIIIVDGDGKIEAIAGVGLEGYRDGPMAEAMFARPNGMAWLDGLLYVADTENRRIRVIDLDAREVRTVAGLRIGATHYVRDDPPVDALIAAVVSPWDLEVVAGDKIAVAIAGRHRIDLFDPEASTMRVLAGNNAEKLVDGSAYEASFNQPSGLAASADGATLWVADAEASAVREIDVGTGQTSTIVGVGLFSFGDVDGVGDDVRLQHALDVDLLPDGTLLVVDTYNNKLKQLDPATREVTTLDWPGSDLALYEPAGATRSGSVVYVADTNNHRLIQHDLDTGETSLFEIPWLEPPALGNAVTE